MTESIDERPDWDTFFMSMAYLYSTRSSDPNTHVGCVITTTDNVVVSGGYNGAPRGIDIKIGDPRLERPAKYMWMEHGERNAIYNANRLGKPLTNCRLYILGTPCADCARAIIQSGITEVVIHSAGEDAWNLLSENRWIESQKQSQAMLIEAKVVIRYWRGYLRKPVCYFSNKHVSYNPEPQIADI